MRRTVITIVVIVLVALLLALLFLFLQTTPTAGAHLLEIIPNRDSVGPQSGIVSIR